MSANSIKYVDTLQVEKDFILAEAGRCVACGLCLPHCPTYQLTQLESESPRGRISLISALATGDLKATDTLESLLDHCLLCRSCEKMCPSSVSFSIIMDKGRNLHKQLQNKTPVKKFISNTLTDFLLHHPEWIRLAGNVISPMRFLSRNKAERSDHARQAKRSLSDYLPFIQTHRKWKSTDLADKPKKYVSLFLGCVARSMDGKTLDDAIFVLEKIGYSVIIPTGQVCCGALTLHSGKEQDAKSLMMKNILAFDSIQTTPVI
ncbi:MAG: (Fe-S)-binding protein, partial [Gammaproteobacteria bacterium]|nr:(Fe-S)-binding protein [Gammaproteobacteria bacterium]